MIKSMYLTKEMIKSMKISGLKKKEYDNIKVSKEFLDNNNEILECKITFLALILANYPFNERAVERVKEASETWGFFQIVNHGIPVSTLKEMVDEVLRFFEQDSEVKKEFYTRELRPFFYTSNYNLYTTAPTTWKDSFYCNLAPNAPKPEDLPAVCRCVPILVSAQAIFLNVYSCKLQSNMLNFSLLSYISNLIII